MRQANGLPHIPWLGELKTPGLGEAERERLLRVLTGGDLAHEPGRVAYWSAILGLSIAAISLLAFHVSTHGGFLSEPARSAGIGPRSPVESGVAEMKRVHSLAAVMLGISVNAAASAQNAVEWRASDGGNGHWYRLMLEPSGLSWSFARERAVAVGGHLATVASVAEDELLFSLADPVDAAWSGPYSLGPWLGGSQQDGSAEPAGGWTWVTGEPWNYRTPATWNTEAGLVTCGGNADNGGGGLAESALHYIWRVRCWNDARPSGDYLGDGRIRAYLVEWSADCNSDGLVDYGQCRDGSLPDFNGNNTPDCCEQGAPCVIGNYPVQWRTSEGGNGHWYQVVLEPAGLAWSIARDRAASLGGYLAAITSLEEDELVFALANRLDAAWSGPYSLGPWLGGSQQDGSAEPAGGWTWVTGEPWNYRTPATWNTEAGLVTCGGNADNGGVGLAESALHYIWRVRCWNDARPSGDYLGDGRVRAFVVEWSSDCNNDGVIDYGQIRAGDLLDVNGNNVPDCCEQGLPCACPADIDRNGSIDGIDLAIILSKWGTDGGKDYPSADIDRSGVVDGSDLAEVLNSWGSCP